MKTTNLFIFDGQTEELLTILSNKNNDQCPFYEDTIDEQLNLDFTFEFKVPSGHEDAQYIIEGNRVVYKDLDGNFQEFQIYKIEESKEVTVEKTIYCEHAVYEIVDDIVEDLRVVNGDVTQAMTKALSSSRWEVGQVDSLGDGTVNFYYSNGMENLTKVVNEYGGELRYRVTLNEDQTKIEHRFVDLLVRRGSDTGRRFEYTKDITSIKRTIDMSGLKTALYPRGNGEEIEETGGYTRKVTIADCVWRVIDGDPIDKPQGQEWVGDPSALEQFGRIDKDGKKKHRMGVFDVDSTDPYEILQKGWEQLKIVSTPSGTYEVGAQDLEIVGLSHEKVQLGDTVFVIDKEFKPVLRLEARVIQIKRSLSNPMEVEIVLGNFLPMSTDIVNELEDVKKTVNDRKGVWDKGAEGGTVTDGSFPDITPPTPTNVSATGLFKNIVVEWDFDPSSYIATYEVYGSQIKGFSIDPTNLLFRGKVGGYVHPSETNQTWYFRVRAVNTHGTPSPFSNEVSGHTLRIDTPDFEELSVTNAIIADLAVDEAKIAELAVTNGKIKNLSGDKITAGLVRAQFVEIGSTTTYENGYDPSKKATPKDVQDAEQRAKDYSKPVMQEVYDGSFLHEKEFWSNSYDGETVPSTTVGEFVDSVEAVNGGKLWRIQGEQWIFSKNAFPVNVNRVYRVTFKVRQTVDPSVSGTSRVYAGVVTLDQNFHNITGGTGTHRYCCASSVELKAEDGWQEFTGLISGVGDNADNFREGTCYVRPMFIVNYQDGDGTIEVDYITFEDVTEIQNIVETLNEVSLRTTEDSIISTVRNSTEYEADMNSKANSADLENYATYDDLDQQEQELNDAMDEKIKNIDFSPFATKSEVEQTAQALDFKFSSSGGVNLLKNSVGFAGTDFWKVTLDTDSFGVPLGSIGTLQNAELQEKGVGSGFVLKGAKITQEIVNSPQYHTISLMVNKGTSGSGYLKVYYEDVNGSQVKTINFANGTSYDYEKIVTIIEPIGNTIKVELYGDVNSNLILTGIMVNVGNVALQWQHSSGEVYNTNVLMDLNGIRVISNTYKGYTAITPEEFAGYAEVSDENDNVVMKRVFTLNKDVTEMSKASIESEITMNPVKVVSVKSTQYNGWAFIGDE